MNKSRFSKFNDGVLFLCENIKTESNFGAVKNATTTNDLDMKLKLNFAEMSKRDEDLTFAESEGRTLGMKVRTRLHPAVNSNLKVLIEDTLYSIFKVDSSREKMEMYIYLEEERKVERSDNDNSAGSDEGDTE